MGTLVMIGGEIRSPDTATISVFDRGFLYGDSVFETIRTYGGELFALTEHLERLESSADKVFISVPIPSARLADGCAICSLRLPMMNHTSGSLLLAEAAPWV